MRIIWLVIALGFSSAYAVTFKIQNEPAQALYKLLKVQEDGSAGHTTKKGKDVVCQRVNAPVDDAKGKPIPQEDPRRYSCAVSFDKSGAASPGAL